MASALRAAMRLKLAPADQAALIAKYRATGRYGGASDSDILAAAGRRDYRQHDLNIGDVRKASWGDLLGARSTGALGPQQGDLPNLGVPSGPGVPQAQQPPVTGAPPLAQGPVVSGPPPPLIPGATDAGQIPSQPPVPSNYSMVPAMAKAIRRHRGTRYSG